jgi:hypothetical protein
MKFLFVISLIILFLFSLFGWLMLSNLTHRQSFEEKVNDNLIVSKGTLENMLIPIVKNTSIENGNCLSYALYYKDYIKKIYPELDIRKIDMAGICPIGTIECGEDEGMPHTYLIINGHGGECILDQNELVCIQMRDEERK